VSYVVASYAVVLASLLLYAGALLRARAGLRKALRAERNRDRS
jgi:hypothetical protein